MPAYCASVGSQPSAPPKMFFSVYLAASSSLSCLLHAKRAFGLAPGPLDSYSLNRAVFSLSGFRQLFQPSGLMWSPNSQLMKATAAYGRQGRPRSAILLAAFAGSVVAGLVVAGFQAVSSPVSLQLRKT